MVLQNKLLRGTYALIIKAAKRFHTKIGALGILSFDKKYYVYFGSAQNSLEPRVKRHLLKQKKLRWHIDYLTASQFANVEGIVYSQSKSKEIECKVCQKVQHNTECIAVAGFGNTDCNHGCSSHLIELSHQDYTTLEYLLRKSFEQQHLSPMVYWQGEKQRKTPYVNTEN